MTHKKIRNRLLGTLLLVVFLPSAGRETRRNPPRRPATSLRSGRSSRPTARVAISRRSRRRLCHDRLQSTARGRRIQLAAIVAGKPASSHLIDQITPDGVKAEMPKGKPPLSASELKTIVDWIAQGATDDTPANTLVQYDPDHPPVYRRPPVIGALDFSPDGSLLAIGGFHEVLVWKADGSALVARLIGLSERIESIRFSPDGSRLAVTGGLPGRMGEVQVWDIPRKKLILSVLVTFDTIYGASWSPDGSKIAFGCADNSVRRSTPRPASKSCSWVRTTTGLLTRPSRRTAHTWFRSVATWPQSSPRSAPNDSSTTSPRSPRRAQGRHRRDRPAPEAG